MLSLYEVYFTQQQQFLLKAAKNGLQIKRGFFELCYLN